MKGRVINLLATEYLRDLLIDVLKSRSPGTRINILDFNSPILSHDILSVRYWIIEALEKASNPAGFRTAYRLTGDKNFLLAFSWLPNNFPWEGPFWCHILHSDFTTHIENIADKKIPTKSGMENLIRMWPLLGLDPSFHSHHR